MPLLVALALKLTATGPGHLKGALKYPLPRATDHDTILKIVKIQSLNKRHMDQQSLNGLLYARLGEIFECNYDGQPQ